MILKTLDLTKKFGSFRAVDRLSISVEKGQIFGFLGPNGAGKSTTIRMLLALIRPSSGSFELFDKDISQHRKRVFARVGSLVEKPDLYEYLSAGYNLHLLGQLNGGVSRKRIEEVLDIVKLCDRERDKVRHFSHGMKQRLSIAQALLNEPELIILDEPTSGLDPECIKEIRELIVRLSRDFGITIFLSSHLLHEVEQVCTHVGIIDRGKLLIQGEVSRLLQDTDFTVTEIVVDKPEEALPLLTGEAWIGKVESGGNSLKVHITSGQRPRLVEFLVQNRFQVFSVIPRTTLEDYYLGLLQRSREID